MIVEEKSIQCKEKKEIILRSPLYSDAKALLEHMTQTSRETYYMARYPEEIKRTVEEEERFLQQICDEKDSFMIAAFDEGKLVGNLSVQKIGPQIKYRHRGGFGISIVASYCNLGLGSIMMKEMIRVAKQTDLEQIELGVFDDNERAKHLYIKMGFIQTGVMPRAFKLKDGSYRDEIQMIYYL